MKDKQNREDIKQLIDSFYAEVRKNKRLSFLFDETAKVDWVAHLPRMYNFWESILFDKALFNGNPMKKHKQLNQMAKLKAEDFDIWLGIFKTNIDKQFKGAVVEKAKQRAESIATITKIKTVFES